MTCYTRHLHWLFEALELEYDRPNRLRVDRAVRQVLDIGLDVPCGQVWLAAARMPPPTAGRPPRQWSLVQDRKSVV